MSLLNVGARALLANQVGLQTAGHNIANVNTPGYSRQGVSQQTTLGLFTGGGYIGQGVDVETITRNYDALVTRQAASAGAVQAGDSVRAQSLAVLQEVFSGGPMGLGAAITDTLNALSDVVAMPTDLTARTVALTRMDEMAARMRSSTERINELQYNTQRQLGGQIDSINSLARGIAEVNEQIARATGNGHAPNDLMDRRDQLIRELNQFVQTTQVAADDGSVGVFVAGSQPLVLGNTPTQLAIDATQTFPGSGRLALQFVRPGQAPVELNDAMLGGGALAGLLRFHNDDLAEGRNLLGRMALTIGTLMNQPQTHGLTLDGVPGKPLFSTLAGVPGLTAGAAVGKIDFTVPAKFSPERLVASDYEVRFTTPPAGQVVRLADGKATAFTDLATLASQQIDGLTFEFTTAGTAGERVLFKPFAQAGADMRALVHAPRDLAAANPVNARLAPGNQGSLQLANLRVSGGSNGVFTPPPSPVLPATTGAGVTLTFNAGPPATYSVSGTATPPEGAPPGYVPGDALPYTSGQPITIDGWEITLQGAPRSGDSVRVGNATDAQYGTMYQRDAGMAKALMALRDAKVFDNAALSDGYAGAMAQIGTRTQSAQYAAQVSKTIADNLERDRTAVSGVNLDEEAARLIQYQQAYQASAKMLQIAQNIFDNVLQSMGR